MARRAEEVEEEEAGVAGVGDNLTKICKAMSMIGNLARIAPEVREELLQSPEKIEVLLYPELGQEEQPKERGFFAKLFGMPAAESKPKAKPSVVLAQGDYTDLDKAWHGVHFLLTGSAWEGDFPLGFLVVGGTQVGDLDVGYGPARVFDSTEVRQIAEALAVVSSESLVARFDPKAFVAEDIYPSMDLANIDEEYLKYLTDYFQVAKGFTSETAKRGQAMLVYIN